MVKCPSCGKQTENIFCKDCSPAAKIEIKELKFKTCCKCKRLFFKNKWGKPSLIEAAIKSKLKDREITKIKFRLPQGNPGQDMETVADVTIDDNRYQIPYTISVTYCDRCSKHQGKYYEGTLQLRNADEEVLDFIETYISKNHLHVSEKHKEKDGLDINISDQRKIQDLGRQLQKRFGGNLKVSPRIFGKDKFTSKEIFRVNVLYEAPKYKKGDVIKIGRDIIRITSIKENISGIDVRSGNKITRKADEIEILPILKTTVAKSYPYIEVLDPETFQPCKTENQKNVKLGEKVEIVSDGGRFYLV